MSTILAVSSSPRRGGNSELLLQSFSQGVQKEGGGINTIRISDLELSPCTACDECAATGECVLQDDMQSIYPLVASARGMVIATPIFFGTMCAQLKMLIDRFQCWWHAKYRLDKPWVRLEEGRPGFFLCVGALKNKAYSESALAVAKVFFHNVNYRFVDSLCYRGIDAKGAIKEYPDALQSAYEAGRRFAVEAYKDQPRGR
ncbi:MAG TPA: flavodoxin family protein [Syntrophaceticus sp.]|jgi:multimeric flavodoxin WrbA|nr:flavodoxin family protein [Syntrophaceticus sp.]